MLLYSYILEKIFLKTRKTYCIFAKILLNKSSLIVSLSLILKNHYVFSILLAKKHTKNCQKRLISCLKKGYFEPFYFTLKQLQNHSDLSH